jgi:Cys-tRNA(Pro) deacylase
MSSKRNPTTRAVLALRAAGVDFGEHPYAYEHKGGTRVSSRELGVDEHAVIKTLVMQDDDRKPLVVLMHGDMTVSTKALARHLGVKKVFPCDPTVAEAHTGYKVGGTSPFGMTHPLPVYLELGIVALDRLYINGGSRGFLVSMTPDELMRVLTPELVDVAIAR